jgi:hypothetical protein
MFARCFGVGITAAPLVALALAVWLIYAGDRILDGLRIERGGPRDTPRHRFYLTNRARVAPVFVMVSAAALWLSLSRLEPALLRNYLLLAVPLATYFLVVHLVRPRLRRVWPKEMAVAMLFAAGTCMPIWTELPAQRMTLLAPLLMLAAILWLNAAGIECWENRFEMVERRALRPAITRLLCCHLAAAALAVAIASALMSILTRTAFASAPLYCALAISAISLWALERSRRRLSPDGLRVLADAALLSPILAGVVWLLR